jgi:predicted transposase YdaD
MSKPFDAATKRLVEADPKAWLRFLGLPGEEADLMDADLSTVTAEADRILHVRNPEYLAHIELQATYKVDMGDRTLFYNVVAYYRYRLPVESAILLLRKEADGPALSGRVAYGVPDDSGGSLAFRYRVVRIWEKSPEELLNAPLALLPLAPLTGVAENELPGVVQRMEKRIDAEAPVEDRGMLWTTAFLLMGLKYDPEFSRQLLQGVLEMKESSTYQYILQEGRAEGLQEGRAEGLQQGMVEGRAEEGRRMLLIAGGKRFGAPDAQTQAALEKITSPEQLEQLLARLFEVESWQELLK